MCVTEEEGGRERDALGRGPSVNVSALRGRSSDLQAAHPDIMQLQSFSVEQCIFGYEV